MVLIWLEFAVCASLILIGGAILARTAAAISEATGLTRSWIGLVLLATATSLPELLTGVSAAGLANAPDIAVGDALGSCLFNLVLIAFLDLLSRDTPIFRQIDQGHILTAAFGIVLVGFVGALIITARNDLDIRIWHFSVFTPFLIVLYALMMRASYFHEQRAGSPISGIHEFPHNPLQPLLLRYMGGAILVVGAGAWLPFIGLRIAEATGWQTSFVGTILIAGATSLPELAVTLAALRLRAVDLAMANLFGSNLFNMVVIAIDDLAYRPGPILSSASPAHAGSAFAVIIMSAIVITAILDRPSARVFGFVGWISLSLTAIYLISIYSIFLLGH